MVAGKGKITWLSYLITDVHLHTARALEIMRHMEGLGYSNTMIATSSAKNLSRMDKNKHLILMPIRYKSVISSILFAVAVFFYLPIHLVVSRPNYVIVSADVSVFGTIPCALLEKIFKTKFILDIRSTPVDTPGLAGSFRKLVFHVSVLIARSLFSGLTIITPLMKDQLCSSYKIDQNEMGVWTSGVSPDSFSPEKHVIAGNELKRKFGLEGKFVVFYHGYLSASRGITTTVESIRLLRKKNPDIVLFLLGSPLYSELEELLHKEDLNENVIVHPPVAHEEVPRFVSFGDVCIVPLPDIPRWRFQSPLKLLEYLAMEKAVIVSNIPAHSEVIGTETCGIYLQSVNPSKISESIEYAYSNKHRLTEWGKSGRVIVQKKHTWERSARNLETYLNSIKTASK